jgi:hypothetical protein
MLHARGRAREMTPRGGGIDGDAAACPEFARSRPMTVEPFSEQVRFFLREHVTSFERLEVLLLLHGSPSEELATSEVTRRLTIREELVAEALQGLVKSGLLGVRSGAFRFAPVTTALAAAVNALAIAYQDQRAAVLSTMSMNAIERIRSGPVKAFADSFVFRKKDDNG